MNNETKIVGLILSGGAGTRAGGRDKGLIEYRGKLLVQHVVEALMPQVDELAIAVHRNKNQYQSINSWIVYDYSAEHEGPMAGIMALIHDLSCQPRDTLFSHIAITSCDTPNIPKDYVKKLTHHIKQTNSDAAVVHDGERKQNLHCLIKHSAFPSLVDFYDQGGRAMHQWFETVSVVEVDFSAQPESFANFNRLDQLTV